MAYEASVAHEALKFADAIHHYAESKGWNPEDYHIFMTANADLLILRIHVVARAFGNWLENQKYQDYDEIRDFIEREVKPVDAVFNSYSLLLSGMDGFAFFAAPRLGPADLEVDEKIINKGTSWSQSVRPKTS